MPLKEAALLNILILVIGSKIEALQTHSLIDENAVILDPVDAQDEIYNETLVLDNVATEKGKH